MVTLPEGAWAGRCAWAVWTVCESCGALFAPVPGQRSCHLCDGAAVDVAGVGRCAVAHPDDSSACEGAPDAVVVVDRVGDESAGCVHHAAVALASIRQARVVPAAVPGAAIVAYERARALAPFTFAGSASTGGGGR